MRDDVLFTTDIGGDIPPITLAELQKRAVAFIRIVATSLSEHGHAEITADMAKALLPLLEAAPASSVNVINNLRRERDGWQECADTVKKSLHLAQCDLDVLRAQQSNDVWIWQGDGEDHIESMGNRMVVCIFARDLRAMLDSHRYALQWALDLFDGKRFGKNASTETMSMRWREWEAATRVALKTAETK